MALVAGTVSVSSVGVATGAGLALALYEAEVAAYDGFPADVSAQAVIAKVKIAAKCAAWALVIDAYVKTATVTVPGVTAGPAAVVGVVT